jgi:uncharacterized LabA/DUF88 family protein
MKKVNTIVYIDGYNLFYGRLKHTQYKWLNLFLLFDQYILKPQNPRSKLLSVKFYTANIQTKFASQGAQAGIAQQRYHQALLSPRTPPVEIIKGNYASSKATPLRYKQPPDKNDRVETWKLEEKQTDVNIALDIYRDACLENIEQIVLCTSDTDIVPALQYIKTDFPNITIGIVFPRVQKDRRAITKSLADNAHWIRRSITDAELAASQFPDRVATNKKPVDKPSYW